MDRARALRLGGSRDDANPWRTISWTVPLVLLPWFNVRYAPVTAILVRYALASRPSRRVGTLASSRPRASRPVALAAYHYVLYGFFDPRLVWGRRPEFALATLWEGLPGLALTRSSGCCRTPPCSPLCAVGF